MPASAAPDTVLRSAPGFFLSGQPLPPVGDRLLRPAGHIAVCVGQAIWYEWNNKQAALDGLPLR